MKYTHRLHQFTKTRCWEIREDGLGFVDENDREGLIPWRSVSHVRLRFEPSRAETRRYAMRIKAGIEYTITNIHYRGIMDFQEQSLEFAHFVHAFHDMLQRKNPNVIYRSGSTLPAYIANVLLSIFVLLLLLVIGYFFLRSGLYGLVAVKTAILLFYIPTMLVLLRKNRPRRYDPSDIPVDLIPA